MKSRFKTKKERVMFFVGVLLSTSIPFLTNGRYLVLPFYITILLCLTGIGLLFGVLVIQKRNGYGCAKKQNSSYLDTIIVEKEAPRH